MGQTKIEWTDYSWTPIRARNKATGKVGWHCEHASPGCVNCYAETFNEKRLGTGLPFKPGHRDDVGHFLDEKMLTQPLRWRKPRMVFVCSMTDLFGEWVPDEWIDRVFAVMALAPQHTFQVLTKRAERMRDYCTDPFTPFRVAAAMDALRGAPSGEEEILPIAGYPGYFVSSHGRIFTEKRGARRVMKPNAGEQGHLRVQLHREGTGKRGDRILVHRIVLETFVGPAPTSNAQGRHLDRDPSNNALGNLTWGDQPANWDDRRRHGTFRSYAKLTQEQAAEIRRRFASGETAAEMGREFGISDTQARNIGNGRQWAIKPSISWPLPNCWKGVSAEDQKRADERVPLLLDTPAAVRWVSAEPLLGPIDFQNLRRYNPKGAPWINGLRGLVTRGQYLARSPSECSFATSTRCIPPELPRLDWIVAGGESGAGARPMHPDWVRSIRDQCAAAGVAFLFKQWGAWLPIESPASETQEDEELRDVGVSMDGQYLRRFGKKAAGRTLDGVTHDAFPEVRA